MESWDFCCRAEFGPYFFGPWAGNNLRLIFPCYNDDNLISLLLIKLTKVPEECPVLGSLRLHCARAKTSPEIIGRGKLSKHQLIENDLRRGQEIKWECGSFHSQINTQFC